MTSHHAKITWKKQTDSFGYKDYNREHEWQFENGQKVRASAAPRFLGSEDCVDPEEAFVASLSACHMLTFLAICAQGGIVVESYEDDAVGFLEPDERKRLVIGRVTLRPRIQFGSGTDPDPEKLGELHHRAHEECFLANSVHTRITVEQVAHE